MFKVNNKDTRTTPVPPECLKFFKCFGAFTVLRYLVTISFGFLGLLGTWIRGTLDTLIYGPLKYLRTLRGRHLEKSIFNT